MTKRSEAKRVSRWAYVYGLDSSPVVSLPFHEGRKGAESVARAYRAAGDNGARAVRLVEVRKGEVVVDANAFCESLKGYMTADHARLVGDMLRKAGAR